MFQGLKRLFTGAPQEAKESAAGSVIYMAGRRKAEWSKRTYAKFADEGYRRNVIAYQAINKTADACAAIPWVMYRGDTEVSEHPVLRLLERPNPMQSGPEFMRALVGFYRIAGNGYIERVRVGRDARELWTLRPDRMTIEPGPLGMPAGYKYQIAGEHPVKWKADPRTGESDIRHLKSFNPLDDWYGLSPIEAGAYAVDQHNEAMAWQQGLLQNSATPSGALVVSGEGELTEEQFNRLHAEIDEKYSGAANAGRPMLLEGGLDWKQMGLSPDQMSIIETKFASARDISLALGVPPLLLNIPGDSTYNNYKEARLAFYEETVIPLMSMIRDELNVWLLAQYGSEYRLDLDLDSVPAIAEKRMDLWGMADKSTDLTINERRELKGYGPINGGDDLFVQSSLIPLTFANEPLPGMGQQEEGGQQQLSAMDPEELKLLAYGPGKTDE